MEPLSPNEYSLRRRNGNRDEDYSRHKMRVVMSPWDATEGVVVKLCESGGVAIRISKPGD